MEIVTPLARPEYSESFRCIGAACEDTCCAGWSVVFDEAACRKYEAIEGPLKVLVAANVIRQPPVADGGLPVAFAKVRLGEGSACPFLTTERLCRIQGELGESFLSVTCATYPRIAHVVDGIAEKALSLSCPEAARLVLLTQELGSLKGDRQFAMSWDTAALSAGARDLMGYFWPVRGFVIGLLRNREYAIWQRLFLVGVFVRRLDQLGEMAGGDALGNALGVAEFLEGFGAAVHVGSLRASMETIGADLPLQLDLVLRLAGLRLPRSHVGVRFLEVVEEFKIGIGNGPEATMESLIGCYQRAYEEDYAPFFETHPHVLENLLVNTVYRTMFPYGAKAGKADWKAEMGREFALLSTQFALIKGLLIGVAGCYGDAFCEEHVVKTVQSASKHFEHHPQFLDEAHALLVSSGLDNARGLTMLVRN